MPGNSNFRRIEKRSAGFFRACRFFFCLLYLFIMIKQILKGYSHLLSSVFKVLFLILFCALTGAAFVFPLWYFATKLPETYTFCSLIILCAFFLFLAVSKIRSAGFFNTISFFTKFFIIALAVCSFVLLVFNGKRVFAFIEIPAALFVYGLVSYALKAKKTK